MFHLQQAHSDVQCISRPPDKVFRNRFLRCVPARYAHLHAKFHAYRTMGARYNALSIWGEFAPL